MTEFPKRKSKAQEKVQEVARAAALAAALAGPVAAGGSYTVDYVANKILENHGLDEAAIAKYLDELKARLATIQERQARTNRYVEMMERLGDSIRTGRLIRDDQFVIEGQIKTLEAVKTIQNVSYWVALFSLWGSLTALFTGILYRKQKFDELHEQTVYLNETQEAQKQQLETLEQQLETQKQQLEGIRAMLAGVIVVLEAQKEISDTIPPNLENRLLEVKGLLENTFGGKAEDLTGKE